MPCTYDPTPHEIAQMEKEHNDKITAKYRKELNKVTRFLCEIMTGVEKDGSVDITPKLLKWWEDHKKRDARRKKRKKK